MIGSLRCAEAEEEREIEVTGGAVRIERGRDQPIADHDARDTAQYPLAEDKEGASGMSLEAAWKDIINWPPLASSGGTFSSLGRPDAVVAYIEGGVNYWQHGADQLIKKIYINAAEATAKPVCGIGFSLNESSQGSLGVVLTVGGGPYCTVFGGVRADRPGRFVAANAGFPAMCALP